MIVERKQNLALWAILIASISLALVVFSFFYTPTKANLKKQPLAREVNISQKQVGVLERMEITGELHAGYGVYPPYTQEDPNTKNVSGFSIDIVKHIAKELGVKIVWHRLNWNTMSADLKRGEYDVVADPIFQTIPRAREFAFSDPYAYFADGIAVVQKNDNRFDSFNSLDRMGVVINVGMGRGSEALVRAHFTKATIMPIAAATDDLQTFQDVLTGRADVAVSDYPNAKRIVNEHPDKLKALFLDHPPAYMPAGFAFRPSDRQGAEFFTICIRNLRSTGILSGIEKKYDLPSMSSMK